LRADETPQPALPAARSTARSREVTGPRVDGGPQLKACPKGQDGHPLQAGIDAPIRAPLGPPVESGATKWEAGHKKKLPQAGQEPVEAVESRHICPDRPHINRKLPAGQRYSAKIFPHFRGKPERREKHVVFWPPSHFSEAVPARPGLDPPEGLGPVMAQRLRAVSGPSTGCRSGYRHRPGKAVAALSPFASACACPLVFGRFVLTIRRAYTFTTSAHKTRSRH
jgi:hypothetical protein